MHARSSTLISATVLFAIACTGGEKSEPVAKNDPEVASKTDPGPAPEAKSDPAGANDAQPDTEAKPDGEAKPEPPKPAEPVVPVEPGVVPITAIAPVTATATWREVGTADGSLQFAYLAGGVVGKTDAGYWDMSDTGQLVQRPEIETPGAEMFGVWPSDVWFVESREKVVDDGRGGETITELRLMRLRSNHRWVPQDYLGEQRFLDEGQQIKKGWKGGLLVSADSRSYTRIAGGADDVDITVQNGEIVDFFETRSGRIYVITEKDAALWAQQDCGAEGCETPPTAVKLPYGTDWEFAMQIPRQRHSLSALAIATVEGLGKHHILHYETGGWKLEQLDARPAGLWPTKGGGLWTQIGSALWHRDPDGNWRSIALPEGAGTITAAITEDQTQLWIAAVVGDKSVVYATNAEAQELPAEGTVTPQTG